MSLERKFLNAVTDDLFIEIAKGNIPGHKGIRKFFNLPNADATERDIWSYGGTIAEYTYTANTGADYYICSSNNSDTQNVIIYLLDEDFDSIIVSVTLTGQTPIKINTVGTTQITDMLTREKNKVISSTTKFTRVWRLFNNGTANFAGNIYVVEGNDITTGIPNDTADVRAYIALGSNNNTLMSHFTIPNDWYGMILGGRGSITLKNQQAADIRYESRAYGKVFRIQETYGLNSIGTGMSSIINCIPDLAPPKTDIKLRADAGGSCGVSGSYQLLLVHKNYANLLLG